MSCRFQIKGTNEWIDDKTLMKKLNEGLLDKYVIDGVVKFDEFKKNISKEVKFEELKSLDTTEKTNLRKALSFIEGIEKDLSDFGKGNLGMNIPVATAQAILKSIKVLLKAGVKLEDAIRQATASNNVSEEDFTNSVLSMATGKKPSKKITEDQKKKDSLLALKSILKIDARAARDMKRSIDKVIREKIVASIKGMVKSGKMDMRQFRYIMSKLGTVNFTNDASVDKFIDYVAKKIQDAEYLNKIDEVRKINGRIRRSKAFIEPIRSVVKRFAKINPAEVSDIDLHLAFAKYIAESIPKSKVDKSIPDIELRKNIDYRNLKNYVDNNQQATIKKTLEDTLREMYDKLFGVGTNQGKTLDEISKEITDKKEADIATLRQIVKDKIAGFKSMLTSASDKVAIEAANLDFDEITLQDTIDIANAINMYLANGFTTGLEKIVRTHKGRENAIKSKLRFRDLIGLLGKGSSRTYNTFFNYIEGILEKKSTKKGEVQQFIKESGVYDVQSGQARATNEATSKELQYKRKFGKIKNFFKAENVVERQLIADILREPEGLENPLENRKKRIASSVKNLLEADETKMNNLGELQLKMAVKLGILDKDGNITDNDLDVIKSKAEASNLEGVNWMIDMWSDIYDDLYNHALAFHSTLLNRDTNYTPDITRNTDSSIPEDTNSMDFMQFTGLTSPKAAGVLKSITNTEEFKNRYLSPNFESNMFNAYKSALSDMYTSGPKQQVNAYMNSNNFKDIVGKKDKRVILDYWKSYIKSIGNDTEIDTVAEKKTKKALNTITSVFGAATLSSIKNTVAQGVLPLFETAIILGPRGMANLITDGFNSDVWKLMKLSGSSIINRGTDVIKWEEKIREEIEKKSRFSKITGAPFDAVKYIADQQLKITNQYPDLFSSKAIWMGYYREYCRKNKIKVDYNNPNKDAAAYAEAKSKVQILPSDSAERGKIATKGLAWSIIRSTLFPFSAFSINQKNRIYADFLKIVRGDLDLKLEATKDIVAASVSLGGFQAISAAWNYYVITTIVSAILDEEEEEDLEKQINKLLSRGFKSFVTDVFSPLPLTDPAITILINKVLGEGEDNMLAPTEAEWNEELKKIQKERYYNYKKQLDEEGIAKAKKKFFDEKAFNLQEDEIKDYGDKFGVLGIGLDKTNELTEIGNAYLSGKVINDYQGNKTEKTLTEKGREDMKNIFLMKLISLGTSSADINNASQKLYYKVKKNQSLTDNQLQIIDELKERYGYSGKEKGFIEAVKASRSAQAAYQLLSR